MKKSIIKITALLLVVGLNWAGLDAVLETSAFYSDEEKSFDNFFEAGLFDFSVTNRQVGGLIGMEALSEIESASTVTKKTGSLGIQYDVKAEKISGDDNFCNALQIELEHNRVEVHDGALVSVNVPVTTTRGTWEFELDLPVSANNVVHGAECNLDLVFRGWRDDVADFANSGFTDEERINLRLTSRMIVLNEFLPNPEGEAYGFDFGNDASSMPQGEWVELYNNSNTNYDLAGWYLWDASGDAVNKVFITEANTDLASAIVPANDWLVVYMNKEVFDNTSDTVKLFDANDVLVDSYAYSNSDYCELQPTPGNENNDEYDGEGCAVPPNKSYARVPDGIGYWVDPIPTPGRANRLVLEIELGPEAAVIPLLEEGVPEVLEEVLEEVSEEASEDAEVLESAEVLEDMGVSEEVLGETSEVLEESVNANEEAEENQAPEVSEELAGESAEEEEGQNESVPGSEESPAALPSDNVLSQAGSGENNNSNGDDGAADGADSGSTPAQDSKENTDAGESGDNGDAGVSESE